MEIYNVNPQKFSTGMNILVYGPSGSGKTTLGSTVQDSPAMRDALFLCIDPGLLSIAARGDIHAIDIKGYDDLEEVFWKLANREPEYEKFKTVVIDSITELQAVHLESLSKDKDKATLPEHGKSTAQLRRLFRQFRDLPLNVVYIAQERTFYEGNDENKHIVEIAPALSATLSSTLRQYVDFVWYLTSRETTDADGKPAVMRELYTRDRGKIRAKTRGAKFAAALGAGVSNPTLPELYDLYLETEAGVKSKGENHGQA